MKVGDLIRARGRTRISYFYLALEVTDNAVLTHCSKTGEALWCPKKAYEVFSESG